MHFIQSLFLYNINLPKWIHPTLDPKIPNPKIGTFSGRLNKKISLIFLIIKILNQSLMIKKTFNPTIFHIILIIKETSPFGRIPKPSRKKMLLKKKTKIHGGPTWLLPLAIMKMIQAKSRVWETKINSLGRQIPEIKKKSWTKKNQTCCWLQGTSKTHFRTFSSSKSQGQSKTKNSQQHKKKRNFLKTST